MTPWARLGTEPAITFQKYIFHYAFILPTLLHRQNCNLGGSEREDRGGKLLLESRKPQLKLWAAGWLQKGVVDLLLTGCYSTVTSIEPCGISGFCTVATLSFIVTSHTLILGVPELFHNVVNGISTPLPSCNLSSLSH